MNFPSLVRTTGLVAVLSTCFLAAGTRANAQNTERAKGKTEKAARKLERVSGVIFKVERIHREDDESPPARTKGEARREARATHKITINTNDVWRDWARDQVVAKDDSPKKAAEKGAKSIATAGEPADQNSMVVVEYGPRTRLETRFRPLDDETNAGKKAGELSAAERGGVSKSHLVNFRPDDLKKGLFVEVDFREVASEHLANAITVIRPIASQGGQQSPDR